MTARKQLTALQAKGQVTIPASIRRKLGLKTGDLIAFALTDRGVLLSRQEIVGMEALETIGRVLREQGVDLDALIATGADIRRDLAAERYGLTDASA